MDLRQLRYFLAVASAGSLSRAARSLYVTQPTLTVAMQRLEKDLDTTLFQNRRGNLELTATGALLAEEGRRIVGELDDLEARIRTAGAVERRPIRLGLTVLFAVQHMAPIARFIGSHPEVEVTLSQDGSRRLQQRLAAGDLDLAVVSFPKVDADLVLEPLGTASGNYSVSVVMPRTNQLAGRKQVGFADLAEQRFSSFSDAYVLGALLPERAAATGFRPNVVFVNDEWEVLLSSLAGLDSVCLLPTGFRELSAHTELAWVPLADRGEAFSVGIATRADDRPTRDVQELIALIKAG